MKKTVIKSIAGMMIAIFTIAIIPATTTIETKADAKVNQPLASRKKSVTAGPIYKNISISKNATYTIKLVKTKAKKFTSSNKKIVTVTNKGKVTAKSVGKAAVKVACKNGKTYKVNFKVFDLDKSIEKNDKADGYDYKVVSLDYYKGQSVEDWHNVPIDVNMFHLFSGAVKMTSDVNFSKKAYDSTVAIHTYKNSVLDYPELEKKYTEWFGDVKGQKKNVVFNFNKAEVDKIKSIGRLQMSGEHYTFNRIILEGKPSDTIAKRIAPATSPVAIHGKLRIENSKLVDQEGKPFRPVGVGFDEGPNYSSTQYMNYDSFAYLRDDWKLNCVRVSTTPPDRMTADYWDTQHSWDIEYRFIDTYIQAAIDAGIYVMLDFHTYSDPNTYANEAIAMFKYVSDKYGDIPNIIYEITNEPYSESGNEESWTQILSYCDKVIPVIRKNAPNAVVAVAGPDGAMEFTSHIARPVPYSNVIYTNHFYAATHHTDGFTYEQLNFAGENGLPVVCSETSVCDALGSGKLDYQAGEAYLALCDKYGYGYFYAGLWLPRLDSEEFECTNEGIKRTCSKITGWKENEYGDVARWYRKHMRERKDQ